MDLKQTAGLNRRQALALAAAGAVMPAAAQQAGFPNKTVRIIVPYTTGGSNDVIARLLAQQLQTQWGQPVVVENRPGAAGNIGSAEVAKAAPDGHTLLLTNINITSMNPALIANMPFDPQKDFAPISLLGTTTLALVVPHHDTARIQEAHQFLLHCLMDRIEAASV